VLNRPAARGRAGRPWLPSAAPLTVSVTVGAPAPLVTALSRSGDDTSRAARVPRRTPGHTNASSSRAASSPDPAMAAARPVTTLVAEPAGAARRWAPGPGPGCLGSAIDRKSSMTCSVSSASARIGSSSGAHRLMQSSRRSWQARHRLRCRDRVNRRAAGSATGWRRPSACGSPSSRRASARICRSSPHLGAPLPGGSTAASAAARAVTSKARRMACRFSRRRRRTSATVAARSRAALRLSRPLVTNRSYIRCRGSGSVATMRSSHWRDDGSSAGESRISGGPTAMRARTASQLTSAILAGCPGTGRAWAAMPSSQSRRRSGRGSLAGSPMARRAAAKTPAAAATAASASGQSRSAQEDSTAWRCRRTTSASAAVRSRVVWDCLNRCTSAASARPSSCAVMVTTPFVACGSAGHEDSTPNPLKLPGTMGDLLISVPLTPWSCWAEAALLGAVFLGGEGELLG